jgi:hypothetical protein
MKIGRFEDKHTARDSRGVALMPQIPTWQDVLSFPLAVALATIAYLYMVALLSLQNTYLFSILVLAVGVSIGTRVLVFQVCRRRRILELSPVDSLADSFDCDVDSITSLAADRGISPKYNVGGVDYYDIVDFGDTALLLRPAHDSAEELLHLVESTQECPDYLLRATPDHS